MENIDVTTAAREAFAERNKLAERDAIERVVRGGEIVVVWLSEKGMIEWIPTAQGRCALFAVRPNGPEAAGASAAEIVRGCANFIVEVGPPVLVIQGVIGLGATDVGREKLGGDDQVTYDTLWRDADVVETENKERGSIAKRWQQRYMEAAHRNATKDELLQIAAAMSAEATKKLDPPKPGESPIIVFEDHSSLQFIPRPGGGMAFHCVNRFVHDYQTHEPPQNPEDAA